MALAPGRKPWVDGRGRKSILSRHLWVSCLALENPRPHGPGHGNTALPGSACSRFASRADFFTARDGQGSDRYCERQLSAR
jgi:hypothetical protein